MFMQFLFLALMIITPHKNDLNFEIPNNRIENEFQDVNIIAMLLF